MSSGMDWDTLSKEILKRAADEKYSEEATQLACEIARLSFSRSAYERVFRVWQANGFHLLPIHYYSPVPDTRTLPDTLWSRESELPAIDMNEAIQLQFLCSIFPHYRSEYEKFSHKATDRAHEYYFANSSFGGTDALALYCMVRHFRPKQVLEVGAGFSTRISAQAALVNGDTKVVSIDPYPDEVVRGGFPGLTRLIPKRVQEVEMSRFEELGPRDILFIDSSHVAKIGSDVLYLFLEVLPRLKSGVVVHVHDIFFPCEYPKDWVMRQGYFWTEQYLLQAFLAFNSAYEVLLCNSYLGRKHWATMQQTFPNSPWWGGGSFWMRRRQE